MAKMSLFSLCLFRGYKWTVFNFTSFYFVDTSIVYVIRLWKLYQHMGVKYMTRGPEHAAKGFSLANWVDLEKNIYNNNKISCKIIKFFGKTHCFSWCGDGSIAIQQRKCMERLPELQEFFKLLNTNLFFWVFKLRETLYVKVHSKLWCKCNYSI